MICFEGEEEKKRLNDAEFLSECQESMPMLLRTLASLYLRKRYQLAGAYEPAIQARTNERIEELSELVYDDSPEIMNAPSIIEHLRKAMRSANTVKVKATPQEAKAQRRAELIRKVLQLRGEGIHSVKDISSLCKISVTTYYLICKREDNNEWPHIRPRGRQFTAESLQPAEKRHIKHMADTPKKSYTVPEMCEELANRFQRTISKKKVYTYLTKTLGYAYKRNNYKAPYSLEPEQVIVKYKVCHQPHFWDI